jgi:protein MpaA
MNPDGEALDRRGNAHGVDLNRNFPHNWSALGKPGDSQYAGTGPGSEPETRAVMDLIRQIKPSIAVWYHQDLNRIDPSGGRSGRISRQYAALTGLPIAPITGGVYTGTAGSWEQSAVPSGAEFLVELGPTISRSQARNHADAVLAIAFM